MSLESGQMFGHYRVVAKIGEGGMGEVHSADDTRLNRKVALKLLPDAFARDAERMARFSREAQLLASLSHPNIAAIFGLEEQGDRRCLVLELIEGQTLDERLRQGPLPLGEALAIARQVAEGLEAAHDSGVIHRDLKPANVKLTRDGTAKILDFGLAKAMFSDSSSSSLETVSPTITSAATQAGVILGTAAYMSPEQAKGQPVDRRTDIWAFGALLHELLTGQRPFQGDGVSETLAAVLMKEPDLGALPAATPPVIRRLLSRCLEKNVRRRMQAIGEARIALDDYLADPTAASSGSSVDAAVQTTTSRASRLPWALAALLAVALIGAVWWLRPAAATDDGTVRLRVQVGTGLVLAADEGAAAVLSPDGKTLAYTINDGATRRLYLRRLDQLEGVALSGTEGARAPFWSPDGAWIGFFTNRQLKKVSFSGGAPLTLADTQENRGGTWSPDGTIVYSPHITTGLLRIPDTGGTPQPVTELSEGERSHRWPQYLPDGQHVLFIAQDFSAAYDNATIEVVNVATRERTVVHEGGTYPRYVPTGHLAYVRSGTLFLAPMDLRRRVLTGTPAPVVEGVLLSSDANTGNGTAHYSFSANGTLAFVEGAAENADCRIAWCDNNGQEMTLLDDRRSYFAPRLSPDNRRLAVLIGDDDATDLWVYEFEREVMTRITFDGVNSMVPVWSADGGTLIFSVNEGGRTRLFTIPADGSASPQQVWEGDRMVSPTSTSPDGHIAVHVQNADSGWDVEVLRATDDGNGFTLEPFAVAQTTEIFPQFSPDGRWIAYLSDETGLHQIYVRPFPGPGGKWQVSTAGGHSPRWIKGGRELVYRVGDQWHSVPLEAEGATLRLGRPQPVLDKHYVQRTPFPAHDVTSDGKRFVVLKADGTGNSTGLTHVSLYFNWFEDVRALTQPGR